MSFGASSIVKRLVNRILLLLLTVYSACFMIAVRDGQFTPFPETSLSFSLLAMSGFFFSLVFLAAGSLLYRDTPSWPDAPRAAFLTSLLGASIGCFGSAIALGSAFEGFLIFGWVVLVLFLTSPRCVDAVNQTLSSTDSSTPN